MNKEVKVSKLQLIILALIVIGTVVTVILVQRRQTLKSRADEEVYSNLQVTGAKCEPPAEGRSNCQLEENTNTVTINGIQKLKELPPP